jgi:hypothetical protein
MKIIITEGQYKRLNKSNESITKAIVKYMNQYIDGGTRKVSAKSRSYGNLHETWCINGKETLHAHYYFENGNFEKGSLSISKNIISSLSNLLSIRHSYILHVIEEWYDDTMVPRFESIVGESGLSIDEIDAFGGEEHDCVPEPVKPEGITDEEMIDYITNNTLYRKDEVIDKIESGERDLDDFYLDIVDNQNRKKIKGF